MGSRVTFIAVAAGLILLLFSLSIVSEPTLARRSQVLLRNARVTLDADNSGYFQLPLNASSPHYNLTAEITPTGEVLRGQTYPAVVDFLVLDQEGFDALTADQPVSYVYARALGVDSYIRFEINTLKANATYYFVFLTTMPWENTVTFTLTESWDQPEARLTLRLTNYPLAAAGVFLIGISVFTLTPPYTRRFSSRSRHRSQTSTTWEPDFMKSRLRGRRTHSRSIGGPKRPAHPDAQPFASRPLNADELRFCSPPP